MAVGQFSGFGLKIIVIIIAAAIFSVGMFFALSFFNSQPQQAIKLQNLPFYDSTTSAVVLSNNTASLSGMPNCDIYISGPSKQIKYFETVSCDTLSSTEISKQDILNFFDNQTGTYTILINSDSQGKILQFAIA